jgi:hypothetical protein
MGETTAWPMLRENGTANLDAARRGRDLENSPCLSARTPLSDPLRAHPPAFVVHPHFDKPVRPIPRQTRPLLERAVRGIKQAGSFDRGAPAPPRGGVLPEWRKNCLVALDNAAHVTIERPARFTRFSRRRILVLN